MPDTKPAWPFTPWPMALEIVGAEGCHLITSDGRRILDAGGGAMLVNIGHGRPEPGAAMAKASSALAYVIPPFVTPERARLVERLKRDWLPKNLTRVFLASGGSEAVEAAVKLARQYHVAKGNASRWKVIGRSFSYHGATVATLLSLGQEILTRQVAALDAGMGSLVPMTMAEVAEALGLHESTVSRVVAGTAVDTPRGTWWLRSLFSRSLREGGPASGALRDRLARLVAAEDPDAPLSDDALATALTEGGAAIARRTVAKYRAMLNLPPAHRRRRRR